MPPAAAIIAAAQAAVDAEPDSASLRLHLSTLLLDAGDAADALPHLEVVLAADSGNVEALLQATRACEALGDGTRAERYRALATTLSTGGTASTRQADGLVETPSARLTLADVGGLDHVKHRLQVSFLTPMRDPAIREAFGRALRGGMLLFGPPGCGKTLIGRALAGELEAHFIRVSVPEMMTAEPGSNLEVGAIFELARQNSPALIFFDDVDALGRPGNTVSDSLLPSVAARLATEMEREDSEGVIVLGASDQPWDIDGAMLGPGRFDRQMLILPPDRPARVAILRHHLRGRQAQGLKLEVVADQLDGYSGSDIAALCDAAVEIAGQGARARPVTREDLEEAHGEVRRSTPHWFQTARNFAVFASVNGMYDDLMVYMRSRRMV